VGVRNYLVEGHSGTGKTSVCSELQRRGHHAVHGDRVLAYVGDPQTGEPSDVPAHEHHIWDMESVRVLVADTTDAVTFSCGGARNSSAFLHLSDGVFVVEVDLGTLTRRLDARPDDEWAAAKPVEHERIVRWHQTKQGAPQHGTPIDATAPLAHVVDDILRHVEAMTC